MEIIDLQSKNETFKLHIDTKQQFLIGNEKTKLNKI